MKQENILKFWRDVEIYDLPDHKEEAIEWCPDEPLPWFDGSRPAKENYVWRYTLLFGKIEKGLIIGHLNKLLKNAKNTAWEEPVSGHSFFSAIILDEQGCVSLDGYLIASYCFGIQALANKTEVSSVAIALEQAREDYNQRFNLTSGLEMEEMGIEEGSIVYEDHLNREIHYLKELNPWWGEEIGIYIIAELVPKDSEPNINFLNSFYLEDLNHLCSVKEKDLGSALQDYLKVDVSKCKRMDLIRNRNLFFETNSPKLMTAGRWPSNTAYGLYTAQMGAINTIFANLRHTEGLQGVNGPPGTGKTTMLLDIIAEIIVDRAKVISDLGCDNLFVKGHEKLEKERFTYYTYNLASGLRKKFGIVVASNNNAAVENISKELPLRTKIDGNEFPEADYFSECATGLQEAECWGVLAAALGNSKNRNTFRKSFWESDPKSGRKGFYDLLYDIYKDADNDATEQHRKLFAEKDKKFRSLLKEFEKFRKLAGKFHLLLPRYLKYKKGESELEQEKKLILEQLHQLDIERKKLTARHQRANKKMDKCLELLHFQQQRKPGFFKRLFNSRKAVEWKMESDKMIKEAVKMRQTLSDLNWRLEETNQTVWELQSKFEECTVIQSEATEFFSEYEQVQQALSEEYDLNTENLFSADFHDKEPASIHLMQPYHSPIIAKLRSEILLVALQLHKEAILANAKKIRNNLNAYFDITAGRIKASPEISQNLWDTFFLCVPVVSTTLASASRLFPNKNKQQLGWLLIDEAGQATPQSACGLINRSMRCVIVGDPLQVEPVVTIPEKLVGKLREEHVVTVEWSPYRTSVQQLADRISGWGTYMQVGKSDEKIWTGFPLRTHRRCDDPMFTIANEIAYDNQMVKAITRNSEEIYLGPSYWFNINGPCTLLNKHVVKEEIDFLEQKVIELRDRGYEADVYVISPFKSIASYCQKRFKGRKRIYCGTIHTFQGKEADIVFLVLGSNPKSTGARKWASLKPNMLNVALTRAKKRIYVIGNKNLWAACNYFDSMAKRLN